jgi:hypothetical protein
MLLPAGLTAAFMQKLSLSLVSGRLWGYSPGLTGGEPSGSERVSTMKIIRF